MITQDGVAPEEMLDPECAVQQRVILLGSAKVAPDAPKAVETAKVGPGDVAGVVPEHAPMERRQVDGDHRTNNEGEHGGKTGSLTARSPKAAFWQRGSFLLPTPPVYQRMWPCT